MVYKLLEHEADMGVYGEGNSYQEAFSEGAMAMYDVMTDIAKVEPKEEHPITCEADSLELLFVEWLNALVFLTDVESMFFKKFDITHLDKDEQGKYQLKAKVWGEKINTDKHELKVEVKAATYFGLECKQEGDVFKCQCVLDI